jgi:molecular chaperone GrpE
MPQETKPQNSNGEAPAPAAEPGPGPQGTAGGAEAPGKADLSNVPPEQWQEIATHLTKEFDEARAKVEDLKGQNLRLMADMDNLRKRTEREKEDTAKYAITRFAQDVVGVIDNFERAAAAVPAEAAERDAALKSFLDGVVLAEKEFLAVLSRHGVRQIEAKGQPFNPHQHQAVMEREDQSLPAGTVLQVFQAGYMIEDRCLRPAMVAVARGGAKANKVNEPAANGTGASTGQGAAGGNDKAG